MIFNTNILFFVAFALFPDAKVDLGSNGVYQGMETFIYRVGDHHLLAAPLDNKLLLFDDRGEVVAHYAKAGNGPGELHLSNVIGVDHDSIWVLSNGKQVLRFDHRLNLIDSNTPPLPSGMRHVGYSVEKGSFMLYQFLGDHLYKNMRLVDNKWVQEASYFQRRDGSHHSDELGMFHHRQFFVTKKWVYPDQDAYSIFVFDKPASSVESDSYVKVLRAGVDDFKPFSKQARIIQASVAAFGKGHLVSFAAKPEQKGAMFDLWWDFFGADGELKKRLYMADTMLRPVYNSDEVFMLKTRDNGDQYIQRLDPQKFLIEHGITQSDG